MIESDIRTFWKLFQSIISFFATANKQLGILRQTQLTIFKKTTALTAAGKTRWGTQYRSIVALLASEEPLKMYAGDVRAEVSNSIRDLIQDRSFWAKLRSLETLLQPLHEWQLMSESNHHTLDKVYPQWIDLKEHLSKLAKSGAGPFAHEIDAYLKREKSGWVSRFERQCLPVHMVAYLLKPANRATWKSFTKGDQEKVIDFLDKFGGSRVLIEFYDYLEQTADFHSSNKFWDKDNDLKLFWRIAT